MKQSKLWKGKIILKQQFKKENKFWLLFFSKIYLVKNAIYTEIIKGSNKSKARIRDSIYREIVCLYILGVIFSLYAITFL